MVKKLVILMICAAAYAAHDNDTIVFMSYPRTGTNWSLASLQVLTNRPITGIGNGIPTHTHSRNRLGLNLSLTKSPIYRTHSLMNRRDYHNPKLKLLMIVRNYREVMLRHLSLNHSCKMQSISSIAELRKYIKMQVTHYLQLIQQFDKRTDGKKYYYTYESLLTDPRKTLTQILEFLEEPTDRINAFMENYNVYQQQVLDSYHEQWKSRAGGSMSKGKSTKYHVDRAPKSVIKLIDALVKREAGPDIWNKYLACYAKPLD